MVLGRASQPLSRRGVHFLLFLEPLARKRAPTVGHGVPQDHQSVPKWGPRVPKMHPKSDLGASDMPRVLPEVSGVPPRRKKTSKRHRN